MQSLIFKSLLSVGIMVLFAGDCNPTPDPIAGQALFKKLAFTVDKVNYDFDFEAEPAPGTLSINDKSVSLANAQQTASGATLVVDGKTYGIAYKNINDTVYLTLTLPEDVGSLPTSITLNTLLVSEKSTLVDQNGASITEGQSLSRSNDAFIAKIISEDGKKNTIYNIQLKKTTTTDVKSKLALFKKLAFTVDKVNYDFDFEAEPAPGTLSINDQSVNLANAQQAGSGYTLVADGKTYGIAYKNINDTVYLTLTLPEDVGSLPTSITLNTLSVSEKSTLVDQNGASITEGQSLSRRNDAFITKIISEDGKKNTIYNIQLKLNENTSQTPTITKLALISSLENEQDLPVDLTAMTVMVPAGVSISTKVFIKELVTSSNTVQVFDKDGKALGENSEIVIEDNTLTLKVGFSADKLDKTYTLQIRSPAPAVAVLSSLTHSYLNLQEENIELVGKSGIIALEMGQRMPSEVTINSYQLADDSKGATVSLSGGSALSISTPTEVTLENNAFKLYVTPVGGETATEYTITFVENLYKESMLMSIQIAYGSTPETVTFTKDETEKTISLASGIGVPSKVTLSEVIVSKGASVKVGETEITTDKSEPINVQDNKIELTVTSQSEESSSTYRILFLLHLQAVSYSGGTTDEGKEIPVLGIAIEDDILTDASVLIRVSGLQSEAMYQYQIGTEGAKQDIEVSSTGEIELKKSHLKNGDDIIIKEDDDIMLYSASANLLGIIARYKKYEIHDWKDLQGMRRDLQGDYTLENHIELPEPEKGGLPKEGFDPIGTSMAAFTGSFNGKGNTINQFSINRPEKDEVGLFGNIESVESVTEVKDVKIAILDSVHGRNYVGCVVGYLQSGTITGVEVTEGKVSGNNNVGGVAGWNYGTITNSYATGDVSGTNDYVGGVAGWNYGTITNSYATGDVSASDFVGGVAGRNYGGTITNSYATGDVSGNAQVGGVAGWNYGTITNSYATGDVSGRGDNVGGVAGYNREGTITNSYATGEVSGNAQVGGVAGWNYGTITHSYATGDVSASNFVGGVAGLNSEGTITHSYATGDVSASDFVGGVAGANHIATITNSYATGKVSGNTGVGGVAGFNSEGTITNSYALGGVSRIKGSQMTLNWVVGLNYAGSVAAGSVADSYYPYRGDNAIDGVNAHDPSSDSVRKTEFENLKKMSITGKKKDAPFNGWNFDAKNGDWEWVSETNQKDLHNREVLLWPILKLKPHGELTLDISTELPTITIPEPSTDFVQSFENMQVVGQIKALKALQDKTADDWQ